MNISLLTEFDPALYSYMYYVYILKNKNTQKLYIGYSNNLKRRLKQHNSIKDVELIYYEAYQYEKGARDRERKLKMYGSAWRGLKQRLKISFNKIA